MKKLFLTFILLGLTTFGFSQTVPLLIRNNTAGPITVNIWAVDDPTCPPACLVASLLVIPAFSYHMEPAPVGGPCNTWGRVEVVVGGTGMIGNPGTCADVFSLMGILGNWDPCGTSACTPIVTFW